MQAPDHERRSAADVEASPDVVVDGVDPELAEAVSVVPRQERSVASTKALVAAAEDLFLERGYHATTLVAIGERAGYSRGLVTTRFGSKENLAWAVVQCAARWWEEAIVAARDYATGLERVVAIVDATRDLMVARPESRMLLERLYAESGSPTGPLHERFLGALSGLERTIAEMIRAGIDDESIRLAPGVRPEAVAGLILAQLRGIGYQWFLFPDLVDPVVFHDLLRDQLVQWLSGSTAGCA